MATAKPSSGRFMVLFPRVDCSRGTAKNAEAPAFGRARDLAGADLMGANLKAADLRGAKFCKTRIFRDAPRTDPGQKC